MILTGRCKEDFEKYLFSFTDTLGYCSCYIEGAIEQDLSEIFDILPKSMRNALIIEWFDSFGINIEIAIGRSEDLIGFDVCIWEDRFKTFQMNAIIYDSRQEATKQAIIRANEIYNNKGA